MTTTDINAVIERVLNTRDRGGDGWIAVHADDRNALLAHIDAQSARIAALEAGLCTVREFVEHELEVREASWIAPNGDDDSGGYVAEARTALDALDLALLEKTP